MAVLIRWCSWSAAPVTVTAGASPVNCNRGLAGRVPAPADRRRNVISITPAGTAHLGRLEELLAGVQDELLAPLSSPERQQLIRLLSRILEPHA